MLYEIDTHQTASLSTNSFEATDEQLMGCIRQGNEGALANLLERHRGLLRTVIARVVHCDADVNDLFQELMLETWNRCQSYDESKGKALGWLVTMARRRAIDRVRRRHAYDRAEERLRLSTEVTAPEAHTHVEEEVMSSERAQILSKLLNGLPDAQREAVHLAFYRGLSQREISAETGIPLGTIKTRLELGIRKLRAGIQALGKSEFELAAA